MKSKNIIKVSLIFIILIGLFWWVSVPRYHTTKKNLVPIMLEIRQKVEKGDLSGLHALIQYYFDTNKTKECIEIYNLLVKRGQKNEIIEISKKLISYGKVVDHKDAESFCNE